MSETKGPNPESSGVVATAIVQAKQIPAATVAIGRNGVMLQSLEDLLRFAKMAVEAGAVPKGMTQGQAALAIQAGLERGMGVMGGLQAAVVINGVLSWRGWAAIALIQSTGLVVPGTFKSWVEGDISKGEARGICVAHRKGYAQPFARTFSIDDAKKAGLWNKDGPWKTRPGNMLEWRAVGDMARFHFPETLGGVPIAEDVEAGGLGPSEAELAEAPPRRELGPPPALVDPLIAELTGGLRLQTPTPIAEAVELGLKMAGVRTEIDKGVDEAFGPPVSVPPPDVKPMVNDLCERCTAPINAMGGCDVCGWPGVDNGERP